MSSGLSSGALYSGTLGVASLPNAEGEPVEVYLKDGKIPVPMWLWAVWDYEDQIVFFFNNPNSEDGVEAIGEVCSTWVEESNAATFVCSFEDVVNPQIRNFIDNHFKRE